MSYVYILKSLKDGNQYTGSTTNLQRRIEEHNAGYVQSTKTRRPFVLYGYQKCSSIKEAAHYEKRYKRSHDLVKRMIKSGKIILTNTEKQRKLCQAGAAQRALPGGRGVV